MHMENKTGLPSSPASPFFGSVVSLANQANSTELAASPLSIAEMLDESSELRDDEETDAENWNAGGWRAYGF